MARRVYLSYLFKQPNNYLFLLTNWNALQFCHICTLKIEQGHTPHITLQIHLAMTVLSASEGIVGANLPNGCAEPDGDVWREGGIKGISKYLTQKISRLSRCVGRDMTDLSGYSLEVMRFLPCFYEFKAVQ